MVVGVVAYIVFLAADLVLFFSLILKLTDFTKPFIVEPDASD